MPSTTQVDRTIESILDGRRSSEPVSNRYPFTYAYDFFRQHADRFGAAGDLSRGAASQAITAYCGTTGQARYDVIVSLADAYIAENNIAATPSILQHLLDVARRECWKSLGLEKPTG